MGAQCCTITYLMQASLQDPSDACIRTAVSYDPYQMQEAPMAQANAAIMLCILMLNSRCGRSIYARRCPS